MSKEALDKFVSRHEENRQKRLAKESKLKGMA